MAPTMPRIRDSLVPLMLLASAGCAQSTQTQTQTQPGAKPGPSPQVLAPADGPTRIAYDGVPEPCDVVVPVVDNETALSGGASMGVFAGKCVPMEHRELLTQKQQCVAEANRRLWSAAIEHLAEQGLTVQPATETVELQVDFDARVVQLSQGRVAVRDFGDVGYGIGTVIVQSRDGAYSVVNPSFSGQTQETLNECRVEVGSGIERAPPPHEGPPPPPPTYPFLVLPPNATLGPEIILNIKPHQVITGPAAIAPVP